MVRRQTGFDVDIFTRFQGALGYRLIAGVESLSCFLLFHTIDESVAIVIPHLAIRQRVRIFNLG